MADSLFVKVGNNLEQVNLPGGSGGEIGPEYVERIEALEEQNAEQDEAIKASMGALPVGFEYVRLTGQAPYPGGVDYFGQEATRAMYADLWAYQNEHRPESIVTEAEWQELYASQNGNVPFYSTGDGSTTFRFPRVVSYLKVGGSVDEMGQYVQEGLPDHTHTRGTMNITGLMEGYGDRTGFGGLQGAFYRHAEQSRIPTIGDIIAGLSSALWAGFDASRSWTGSTSPASESNSAYRNSSHVTPETMTIVMGVIAISVPGVLGAASEAVIYEELALQSAELESVNSKADAAQEAVRAAQEAVRAAQATANAAMPRSGGHFDGGISVPSDFLVRASNNDLEGGEIRLVEPNNSKRPIVFDNYNNRGRMLAFPSPDGSQRDLHIIEFIPQDQRIYCGGREMAREHNLYVNLGGYIYGSGGVWFGGLDGQTIGVNTALSNCNCDCSDGCGSY